MRRATFRCYRRFISRSVVVQDMVYQEHLNMPDTLVARPFKFPNVKSALR
jgi:hypothetical protein